MIQIHVKPTPVKTKTLLTSEGAMSNCFTPGSVVADSTKPHPGEGPSMDLDNAMGLIQKISETYTGAYFTHPGPINARLFTKDGEHYLGLSSADGYAGAKGADGEPVDPDLLSQAREVAGYKMSYWRAMDLEGQIDRFLHSLYFLLEEKASATAHVWHTEEAVFTEVWVPAREISLEPSFVKWLHLFMFEMSPVISKPR